MQRLFTSLALLLALWMGADTATALGLGRVGTTAALGQPLNFTIALRLDANESIETRCVKAEVTYGERVLPDAAVRARVESAAGAGERRVRVTTSLAIDEPVVVVRLQLGCPSSLSRDFTLLAEPPGTAAVADSLAQDGWISDREETSSSPLLAVAPAAVAASTPAAGNERQPRARRGDPQAISRDRVEARAGTASPAASNKSRANVAHSKPRGPVLRLDPIEADALILPDLQMETRLSMPPESPASQPSIAYLDPEIAQRREDQARLKAMEAVLLKLRADSEATQKSLEQMQQRVRAAEAARYANPLVYLLVVVCLLMGAGLLVMVWLRRRDRVAAAWWAEQPSTQVGAARAPNVPSVTEPVMPSSTIGLASAPQPLPAFAPEPKISPPSRLPDIVAPIAAAPAVRTAEPDAAIEPRRPMSAEELIDLEQQAEFFVVLGQDDAAIDLLMGHVRSTGGVSPLPYLKLLEIYRRRGEREPYDRIRERFNRRFNAYAPEWDVDPEEGLSLEGYPEVMQRLQDAWDRPSQAMQLLDTALFRRDAGPAFDVPAYRELLFLYSTARDLAERDVGTEGVDLLLPFGGEAPPMMTSVAASQPLSSASSPPLDGPSASFSLDLDVSTDQPALTLEDIEFKDDFKKKTDR